MKYVPYYVPGKGFQSEEEFFGKDRYYYPDVDDPFKRGGQADLHVSEKMSEESRQRLTDNGFTFKTIPAELHKNMFGCQCCGNRSDFEFELNMEMDVVIEDGQMLLYDSREAIRRLIDSTKAAKQLEMMSMLMFICRESPIPTDPDKVIKLGHRYVKSKSVPVLGSLNSLMGREDLALSMAPSIRCCNCGQSDTMHDWGQTYGGERIHSGAATDEGHDYESCGGCHICSSEVPDPKNVLERCITCIGYDYGSGQFNREHEEDEEEEEEGEDRDDFLDHMQNYANYGLCGDRECGNLMHVEFFGLDQFDQALWPRIIAASDEAYESEVKFHEEYEAQKNAENKTMEDIVDG